MIEFKAVRWKNFLSTGDNITEIKLNRNFSTLIVGQNGSGKSTLLDALSFALFGKPHRSINKPQLVNSVNKKNCIVEVEFRTNNIEFKIIRGLKPGLFEIYQNGKMIDQSSNTRDYQKFLEQNILHLNHKSFHQIVVLGSSSFIPFMQLPAQQRREVIEDILDIQIFSKMNGLLKESNSKLKEEIKNIDHQIELVTQKIEFQKKHIKEIRELTYDQVESKKRQIADHRHKIDELIKTNEQINALILSEEYSDIEKFMDKYTSQADEIKVYSISFKNKLSALAKDTKFFESNENCPTCLQKIDEEFKLSKINESKTKSKDFTQAIEGAENKLKEIKEKLKQLKNLHNQYLDYSFQIKRNNDLILMSQENIDLIQKGINDLSLSTDELNAANEEYSHIQDVKNSLIEKKSEISEQRSYNEAIGEMLKDTGIKTKIIKQYIPVMNKLINYYLNVLDFFVSFNLNDSFQEEIKSRYRDDFTYQSFSEGEKQRIDLALLFTWRQIAKMKNSTNTNLLILDETFDSSMDIDGVENLMKILETLDPNTNTFVISHKGDLLESKFRNKIEFIKERNFSRKISSM